MDVFRSRPFMVVVIVCVIVGFLVGFFLIFFLFSHSACHAFTTTWKSVRSYSSLRARMFVRMFGRLESTLSLVCLCVSKKIYIHNSGVTKKSFKIDGESVYNQVTSEGTYKTFQISNIFFTYQLSIMISGDTYW